MLQITKDLIIFLEHPFSDVYASTRFLIMIRAMQTLRRPNKIFVYAKADNCLY